MSEVAAKRLSDESADISLARPISLISVGMTLRAVDLLIVLSSGLVIHALYVNSGLFDLDAHYAAALLVGGAVSMVMLQWSGAYELSAIFERRIRFGRIISGWAIAFSLLITTAFILKISYEYSRVWAASWFASGALLMPLAHAAIGLQVRRLARQGRFAARTVILGAGENGQRLVEHLRRHGDLNTRLIGFVDDRQGRVPQEPCGLPLLGDRKRLLELVRRGLVDQVFVALPWRAESRIGEIVHDLATTPVQIRLTPDLVGFRFMDRSYAQVARLPVVNLYDRPLSGWPTVLKAVEDRVLAGLALLFLAPLMALVALAIKLDSPGPIFFRQQRLGFNNNLIEVWKFRSMYVNRPDNDEVLIQATRGDPRVTRVGAFLRRSSIDELPQLFNVLFGSMSLVGPRPHAMSTRAQGYLFDEVVDRYAARHRVKPGITGWAQVNGWRGETDTVEKIRKRVEYDLFYIDNWSLWLDIEILWRTVMVIFKDRNAY